MSSIQEMEQSVLCNSVNTYHNKPYYANGWSRVPSYDAFPSFDNSQFHTNSKVFGSKYVASKPFSNISAAAEGSNTRNIMEFHSSYKWKQYLEASKHSNRLIVVFFTATWCGPCRTMEPTIKGWASQYTDNVDFVRIDVDELLEVSLEYGIQTMPTFLLMKNGKQMDKVVGAIKDDLHTKIEMHRI